MPDMKLVSLGVETKTVEVPVDLVQGLIYYALDEIRVAMDDIERARFDGCKDLFAKERLRQWSVLVQQLTMVED